MFAVNVKGGYITETRSGMKGKREFMFIARKR